MKATRPRLALLLPPSEGKAPDGDGPPWEPGEPGGGGFASVLGGRRAEVVAALAAVGGGDEKLLGVTGRHLARAQEANRLLIGAPTLPACRRYTGVVWDHLDVASLPKAARRRAADAIVVVSGLLGVVALDDPVPDYRLKMAASLPPLGKLSTWWRPAVSAALNDHLEGRFVVDLLPNEHRAAWTPTPDRYADLVSVAFVERDGRGTVAGHDAKAAKGLLARHLVTAKGSPLTALRSWRHARFDLRLS